MEAHARDQWSPWVGALCLRRSRQLVLRHGVGGSYDQVLGPSNWYVEDDVYRYIHMVYNCKGHISTVRGVVVSHRHPYLFSCGEDKTVKCWDLEQNKIIRDYHGHLSGVYCMT